MKTADSHRSSEGDLAKALERGEEHQDETTPEKKAIEKLKLTVDDLQQYGKRRRLAGNVGRYGCLSWSSPTCSFIPHILILPRDFVLTRDRVRPLGVQAHRRRVFDHWCLRRYPYG
jgi:hypothetical protein